ncbi:collagen-like protein [Cytophaga sp. FL35]|uniref:collagen-like protein n=1 Tax=Cytophaga sp. FL35 TaxID=1904456 RepID=UPI001653BFBC|nr:collagen-like protein [Cytophaga sp. FL35]MBC6999993.1 collagen-like protein [Cytophaga sp. FL35]
MKKFNLVIGAFLALVIVACEGPAGPPGRDGLDGLDGLDGAQFEAAAFEIEVDLATNLDANRYEYFSQYPSDITLLPDDVILMYRLEEIVDGADVWRQLPQPFFADEGLLYYNFDFTQGDYTVLLEPEFDLSAVPTDLTDNQIFRIVIIPSDLGTAMDMDQNNINSVMNALGIQEGDIKKIQ